MLTLLPITLSLDKSQEEIEKLFAPGLSDVARLQSIAIEGPNECTV